jgi:alkylation response protein AidB-like acyl-CoA dehydrogenase
MDFEFTENQLMMRDMVRAFARREIAPLARLSSSMIRA